MTSPRRSSNLLAALICLIALGGCGGSGGGGKASTTVTVIFPPDASSTLLDEIRVQGTTSSGADMITVAGIPATSTDGFLTWSCAVSLITGTNAFDIILTQGSQQEVAKTIHVESGPELVTRLAGLARGVDGSLVYTSTGGSQVVHRQVSGAVDYKAVGNSLNNDSIEFDSQRNRLFFFTDFNVSTVDSLTLLPSSSVSFSSAPIRQVESLALDTTTGNLYVAVRTLSTSESIIYEFDPDDESLVICSDDLVSGLPQNSHLLHLDHDVILGFLVGLDPDLGALIKIDPMTGQRSVVADNLGLASEVIDLALRDGMNVAELLTEAGQRISVDLQSGQSQNLPLPVLETPVSTTQDQFMIPSARPVKLIHEPEGSMLFVRSDRVLRIHDDGSHEEILRASRGERFDLRFEAFRKMAWDSQRKRLIATNNDELLSIDRSTGSLTAIPKPVAGHVPFIRPIRYDASRDLIYYIAAPTASAAGGVYSMPATGGEETLEVPLPEGYQARDADYDPVTGEYLTALQFPQGGPLSLTLRRSAGDGTTLWEHHKMDDPWLSTWQFLVHAPSNSFFGRRLNPDRLFHMVAPGMVATPFAPLGSVAATNFVSALVDDARLEYLIVEDSLLRIFDLATLASRSLEIFDGGTFPFALRMDSLARDPETGLIYLATASRNRIAVVEPESLSWVYLYY